MDILMLLMGRRISGPSGTPKVAAEVAGAVDEHDESSTSSSTGTAAIVPRGVANLSTTGVASASAACCTALLIVLLVVIPRLQVISLAPVAMSSKW